MRLDPRPHTSYRCVFSLKAKDIIPERAIVSCMHTCCCKYTHVRTQLIIFDMKKVDINDLTEDFGRLFGSEQTTRPERREVLLRPHIKHVEFSDVDKPLELTDSDVEEMQTKSRPRQPISRPRRF